MNSTRNFSILTTRYKVKTGLVVQLKISKRSTCQVMLVIFLKSKLKTCMANLSQKRQPFLLMESMSPALFHQLMIVLKQLPKSSSQRSSSVIWKMKLALLKLKIRTMQVNSTMRSKFKFHDNFEQVPRNWNQIKGSLDGSTHCRLRRALISLQTPSDPHLTQKRPLLQCKSS